MLGCSHSDVENDFLKPGDGEFGRDLRWRRYDLVKRLKDGSSGRYDLVPRDSCIPVSLIL